MFIVLITPFPKALKINTVNDFALVWFKGDRTEVLAVGYAHTVAVRNGLITCLREIGDFLGKLPSEAAVYTALKAIDDAWKARDKQENVIGPIEIFLEGQLIGYDIPKRFNLSFVVNQAQGSH